MEQKTIKKIEHVARNVQKMGFVYHASLLWNAIDDKDTAMVQRVATLLRKANRKAWADLLSAAVGVPGWDKVEA
jgi:hypothetical protein